MNVEHFAAGEREALFENLSVELTDAAYGVALRHGVGDKWLDLQMDLWGAMTRAIENLS
jgi:hypothetical protein